MDRIQNDLEETNSIDGKDVTGAHPRSDKDAEFNAAALARKIEQTAR